MIFTNKVTLADHLYWISLSFHLSRVQWKISSQIQWYGIPSASVFPHSCVSSHPTTDDCGPISDTIQSLDQLTYTPTGSVWLCSGVNVFCFVSNFFSTSTTKQNNKKTKNKKETKKNKYNTFPPFSFLVFLVYFWKKIVKKQQK